MLGGYFKLSKVVLREKDHYLQFGVTPIFSEEADENGHIPLKSSAP